jgi:tRNA modification GTPase
VTTNIWPVDDLIAALASPAGPAPRGIIRMSGPEVRSVVGRLFRPDDLTQWAQVRRPWRHPGTLAVPGVRSPLTVDVLLWPTRRSYTGQPLAELHLLGSPPLLEAVLQALYAEGVRPAERGEFTLRAFLAGRIDLMQAEAVLGVIDATDQHELRVALEQMGGGLSRQILEVHEDLLLVLADLEAGLDFVDEDLEFVTRAALLDRIDRALTFLDELSDQSLVRLQSTGRRRVVLAGLPNAGKSTLFNVFAGHAAALVSAAAGTTRDYLCVPFDLDGMSIELIDTAGWDPDAAGIGHSADARRDEQWQRADLIVWCTACDLDERGAARDRQVRDAASKASHHLLHIATRADLARGPVPDAACVVSALTAVGLESLGRAIVDRLAASAPRGVLGSTAARCRDSLRGAREALWRARQGAEQGLGDELLAIELRESLEHLGQVAGRVYTEDLLDRIFSRFCIGK